MTSLMQDFFYQQYEYVDGVCLVRLQGWAWSGGGRGIARVDVSADGHTWTEAELQRPEGQTPGRSVIRDHSGISCALLMNFDVFCNRRSKSVAERTCADL